MQDNLPLPAMALMGGAPVSSSASLGASGAGDADGFARIIADSKVAASPPSGHRLRQAPGGEAGTMLPQERHDDAAATAATDAILASLSIEPSGRVDLSDRLPGDTVDAILASLAAELSGRGGADLSDRLPDGTADAILASLAAELSGRVDAESSDQPPDRSVNTILASLEGEPNGSAGIDAAARSLSAAHLAGAESFAEVPSRGGRVLLQPVSGQGPAAEAAPGMTGHLRGDIGTAAPLAGTADPVTGLDAGPDMGDLRSLARGASPDASAAKPAVEVVIAPGVEARSVATEAASSGPDTVVTASQSAAPAKPGNVAPTANAPIDYAMRTAPGDPGFGDEVVTHMRTMLRDGVQEARIQLHPAELGRLQVNISTEGDRASVFIVADGAATREAIEQSLFRLREMLAQQGLQLAQADVSERGSGDPSGRGGAGLSPDNDGAEQAVSGSLAEPDADAVTTLSVPSRWIDTYA